MKTILLCASVAILGVWLGFLAGNISDPRGRNPSTPQTGAAPVSTLAKTQQVVTWEHLYWERVTNGEPRIYTANLRAIGCPEWTVAAIVRAMVLANDEAKVNLIYNPLAKYWSRPEDMAAVDAQVKAIHAEGNQLLDSLNLQEEQFRDDGLSVEKVRYVAQALELYPQMRMTPESDSADWERFLENRRARIEYLSQFLTPDELLTYRIIRDGAAPSIGTLLRDINPTDDEFRKVFNVLDGENLNQYQGLMAEGLEAKLKKALGDERYAEYREQMAPENFYFNLFVHSLGLTDAQAQELRELRSGSAGMEMAEYKSAVAKVLPPSRLIIYFSDPFVFKPNSH